MVRGPFYISLCWLVLLTLDARFAEAQPVPEDTAHSPSDVLSDVPSGYGPWYDTEQPREAVTCLHSLRSHCQGVYAGVELVIVKPYWEDEVDTLREETIQDGDPSTRNEIVELLDPDYSCGLSPRIYLGYRNCDGLGTRVRYWYYNASANPLAVSQETGQGDQIQIDDKLLNAGLQVQALDWEATKRLSDGRFSLDLNGGVRYAKTKLHASFNTEQRQLGEDPHIRLFYAGRAAFEGVGPTISAEGYHRLGNSNFSVVGNLRGSLLFGNSRLNAEIRNFARDDDQWQLDTEQQYANQGKDDLVPVIEAQFGAEYGRQVGRGRLAIRALMEGQWWGIATPGASFSRDVQGAIDVGRDPFDTGRDLGFFGVTAAVIYDF